MKSTRMLLFLILAIVLSALAYFPVVAGTESPRESCTVNPQAGKLMLPLSESEEWGVIQFNYEFCKPPILVVSAGESSGIVRVGVVTPAIAWVQGTGAPGQTLVIYWHAMLPTE